MDEPMEYEIRVQGHLPDRWSDWFAGMAIQNDPGGETIMSGSLMDQAALFGILNKIHGLNLTLISVSKLERCD